MCDFIGYEIKDRLKMKNKIVEEEENWQARIEPEKVQEEEEQPIIVTQ
jgi:hypothetical protein